MFIGFVPAWSAVEDVSQQELQRQQERERVLRERQEKTPDVRLSPSVSSDVEKIPESETPCFPIRRISLKGDQVQQFEWALKGFTAGSDSVLGRCLGGAGINFIMRRIQNAIVERG